MQVQKSHIIAVVLAIVILLFVVSAYAHKIAILPFENMSGNFEALTSVMSVIYELMGEKAHLVPAHEVEKELIHLQLRHTAYLTTADAATISKALGACSILTGMICLYEGEPYPKIGLIIKIYNTKEKNIPISWMDSAVLDSSDTESWLGRRRFLEIHDLTHDIFKKLLTRIPFDCAKK
ncbi:MAG: hypothetical protein ACMUJM_09215 [bacterium]